MSTQKLEYINFDSFGVVPSNNSNYSTFPYITNSKTQCPHQFNTDFILRSPKQNVKRVYLVSMEIPMAFNNIRSTSFMNFIKINCDGVVKQITIPDGTYTEIESLIVDLNTASSILYPSQNIIFALDASGKMSIIAVAFTSVTVITTNLSYILGWRDNINTNSAGLTIAGTKFLLAHDLSLNFIINNFTSTSSNFNGTKSTFKIPINSTSNTICYVGDNTSFSQYCENNSSVIDRISVSITDRYGYSLHSNSIDYSFTLLFVS